MQRKEEEIRLALKDVVPTQGLLYSQKSLFREALCPPMVMPLKSLSLVRLEERQKEQEKGE